ncbi:hypothetical protein [Bacteroides acidifaciens]|uniref:hypothetical protein n=1 Tax=Bacteroides acidifaciens TaxID=85831 RepID=UPI00261C49BE|nr:hypothetical protein [Bacteroides acidifaciens]
MTLYGNYFLKSISQNPYRILGVTANTPKKDIIANVSKFKAFLKVGKPISGIFDSISGTSHIDRTVESIISAEKALELPIDRLRWTLFWFVNKTPIDKIALNHVQSGNIDKAIEIWSKVESVTSLLNLTVLELTQQNWERSALYADRLFSKYASAVCALVDDTLDLSQQELMRLFMDAIAEDNYVVLKSLYQAFPVCYTFDEVTSDYEYRYLTDSTSIEPTPGVPVPSVPCFECTKGYFYFQEGHELTKDEFFNRKENLIFVCATLNSNYELHRIYDKDDVVIPSRFWDTCIRETLVVPYVEKAKARFATLKAITKDEIEKRFEYVKSEFLSVLGEIYSYLGGDNSEYLSLNNQFVKEALQCSIEYYNNSDNPDDIAREVRNFVRLLKTQALPGSVLRQRCEENYDTLCEICSKLPPDSVAYYHKLLKVLIDKFRTEASTIQNASAFVNKCFPYLMSIKSVLGLSNAYFQRMCTRVADDALEDIIVDYNEKSESLHDRLEKATSSNRSSIIKLIQDMMKSAVITMYHLKQLGLEPEFRQNRFNNNYEIIVKQARNARALGANSILAILGGEVSEEDFNNDLKKYAPDLRDEKGYFSSIKNLQDCYDYRRIFPEGKFTLQVNSKVEEYEYSECSSLEDLQKFSIRYPSTKFDIQSKREEIIFKSCKTIEDYKSYIANYSTYKKEAEKRIDDLIFGMCRDRASFAHYLATYPNGGHRLEAKHKLDDIDYRACKTADDFENYLKSYPHGCHVVDAKKRLEEEKFWAICIKKDSWKLYKEYLSKFPYGKYNSEAKKKSKSPKEKFNEWRSNNGCLFTIIIILLIALVIAGFTNGIEGIGYVFAAIGAIGVFGSIGKGDLGCGFRIASLGIGVVAGAIGIGLISVGEELSKSSKAANSYESLDYQSSIKDYSNVVRNHYSKLNATQQESLMSRYYRMSLDSCSATIEKYSTGGYNSKISGLGYLTDFIDNCPNSTYKERAETRVAELVDSLYNTAVSKNSYTGWEEYQNAVSSDDYRDSDERKDAVDTRWNTESNAWATAQSLNNIAGYERYLSLFPNGKHRSVADKKVIDMTVASTFAGEHGSLPEMDQVGYGGGSTSYVSVTNSTSYTLTLMYSGNESKRLVLSPNSTGSVRLKNGSYRIAASVSASNVSKYAGTESLNGGSYEVEYYISTSTVPSYRHY